MLGYLIAQDPASFCKFFGFRGRPLAVKLEVYHDTDRSDILVETNEGIGIIEAKVSPTDPISQAAKYGGKWHVLLTDHAPSRTAIKPGFSYVSWKQLYRLLESFLASSRSAVRFISQDLIAYLEEHRMIRTRDSVEIYAREINEEKTLELFLKGHLYGCYYEKGSRLAEALYFAPHFGQKIARNYPGVQVGISYIAKIETVEIVRSWKELLEASIRVRSKQWLNSHLDYLSPLHRGWDWKTDPYYFLFLGTPRLAFNPPILKDNLQKGSGFLSKRFHSFEDLFKAWGC